MISIQRTLTRLNRTKFELAVEKTEGCWEWQGEISRAGYGTFYCNNKKYRAHRFSYVLYVGKIKEGLVIDHLCRNRKCVNPEHLEPVTPKENVLRGDTIPAHHLKKTHCPKGHAYDVVRNLKYKNGRPKKFRACRKCINEVALKSWHKCKCPGP